MAFNRVPLPEASTAIRAEGIVRMLVAVLVRTADRAAEHGIGVA
jgi:hypothetical protein